MTQNKLVNERVAERKGEKRRSDHSVIMCAIKVSKKELKLALAPDCSESNKNIIIICEVQLVSRTPEPLAVRAAYTAFDDIIDVNKTSLCFGVQDFTRLVVLWVRVKYFRVPYTGAHNVVMAVWLRGKNQENIRNEPLNDSSWVESEKS